MSVVTEPATAAIPPAHRGTRRLPPLRIQVRKPSIIVWPTRFFIPEEPETDGHRHEYGTKSMKCENQKAARYCGRMATLAVHRKDKWDAQVHRWQADLHAREQERFYAEQDEAAPYHLHAVYSLRGNP